MIYVLKFQLNTCWHFNEITVKISMKYWWKYIENSVEIQLKYWRHANKTHLKSSWNFIHISIEIQRKPSWNFNAIPLEIFWKFQFKFNRISNVNPSEIQLKNIATGETSPAITPHHNYHFSMSTSLSLITRKLPSQTRTFSCQYIPLSQNTYTSRVCHKTTFCHPC